MGQGFTKGIPLDTDGTLSSNSDQLVPSQKAVKTYVDARATGTNTGDETASTLGATINASSAATPNDTDLVTTVDTSVVKKITWANVKAFLKTYFDTIYQAVLVSGTNIKTINGSSVLGSGNLVVTGSGASWGSITGTLSSQTDLQSALDGKVDANTPITGATKTKITYDANGLVTAGADASTADIADSLNKRYVTDAQLVVIGNTSGTNTGDQTSIVGISGTKANFDTACSDGNFLYVGDITQYTDENAQDAVGGMATNSTFVNLTYVDATPSLTPSLSATGTPSATTFLRGDNTWATPTAVDPAGWTTIVKSANQDVTNNATFQDDSELQFSVVANGHYMVEMNICWSANDATGDYKFAFTISTGTIRGYGVCVKSDAVGNLIISTTGTGSITTSTQTLQTVATNLDFLMSAVVYFNIFVSANATFKYQFANNSAGAGRTSRTWKGSILKYKRID